MPAFFVFCEPCLQDWTFIPRPHTCYLAPHHPLTWQAAEHHCQSEGGHLVSIENAEESQFIRALADQHNPQFLTWIGLKRHANALDTAWTWASEVPVNYTDFQYGQPSDWGDCVALSSSLENPGWVTVDCEYSQFFLCQMPADGWAAVVMLYFVSKAVCFSDASIVMRAVAGEFYSPGFPDQYPDETSAHYFIELSPEKRIAVTVEYIDTEEMHDILQLFDGPSETSRTLARLSGEHYNRSFLSTTNALMAEFSSDKGGSGKGFKVRYSAWSLPPVEKLQKNGGSIHSSKFPGFAPPFTFQHFLIQCSDEEHIHFNVTDLELSHGDELVFYEGTNAAHGLLKK
ncbi:lectin C-type domain protein [Oesophagostomum dentatum]|uniref:Lectin C-type domain protein n=1 Tax=Oesophagostomum dentatum TaxID=61180 RepID=A0A0B1T695_OESDE|nr:lectin C-type domain protein [Oesophagostomum dentatum]